MRKEALDYLYGTFPGPMRAELLTWIASVAQVVANEAESTSELWQHRERAIDALDAWDEDSSGLEGRVVFVPQGAAEVRRQLAGLEAKWGQVHHFDSRELMTEQGIHRSFAEVLQFPGYFGRNWDALVDGPCEFGGGPRWIPLGPARHRRTLRS